MYLPTGPFSLVSKPSDALWPRHLAHLPAAFIGLSVITCYTYWYLQDALIVANDVL